MRPHQAEAPSGRTGRLEVVADFGDERLAFIQPGIEATSPPAATTGYISLDQVKARYGPYADNLNHVLQALESHYLRGYGDRTSKS